MSLATVVLAILVSTVVTVVAVNLLSRYMDRRYEHKAAMKRQLEEAEKAKEETRRIATLPKLDTSHMLAVPITAAEMAENINLGGTFGNRYIHMLVKDRDGAVYLCFMTEHNLRALWSSEFHQAGYEPSLRENDDDFVVDDEKIGVYPALLRNYPHHSDIWTRWAELHREFYAEVGNNFCKYFEHGRPRKQPLETRRSSGVAISV
jgi:hypothetical protein